MIDVESLTRYYGKSPAVKDVSFSIAQHEIVGLLGHNGAGKTTVMKMLSGYLEPSAGSINIDGQDLKARARDIQKTLGYLPENLPIYPEMTIGDCLDYAAHLKGLRGNAKQRAISYSVAATELGDRFFDPIGELSRGFKQRVGVAQAILGKPRLLILDEPGNGLDPEQNEHMRQLIRELAKDATVILSTHVMQEVDALCDRVLVLSNGQLALDSPLATLRESHRILLRVGNETSNVVQMIQRLPQVLDVTQLDHDAAPAKEDAQISLRISLHDGTAMDTAAGNISRAIIDSGARLYQLMPEQRALEHVFRDAVQAAGGKHGS